MAMAMGSDNSSPLSLGKQEFNWPDLFTAVLQLCIAGLFAIILNAWIQKKSKAVKTKSVSFNQAIPQTAPAPLKTAAAAQTSAPTVSQPRAPNVSPPVPPATPKDASAPAVFKSPQPATVTPTKPQTPAAPAAAPPKPAPPKPAPKQPKEVYYNIVGERITPLEDDTADQ
jgi:cytoskeletal protein RodZ